MMYRQKRAQLKWMVLFLSKFLSVLGNGEHTFYTGTNCCIDTISDALKFTLTGIVSVPPGTGPGPVNTVPVPAAAWLFGSAALGFLGFGRRNRKEA